MTTFNEFNLNEDILKAVSLMGFDDTHSGTSDSGSPGGGLIGLAIPAERRLPSAFPRQRLQADNHQFRPWSPPVNWPCRWRRN